tara:strand:- start:4078 stop:4461 length:384 start_codon:yes stop_codon:yes gene_type:complete
MTDEKTSEEDFTPQEEKMKELAKVAQRIVDESKTVQVATVTMLNAWRLFYAARAVVSNYMSEEEGISPEDQVAIGHILSSSLLEAALEPYKVDELTASLEQTCIPFLKLQEDNIVAKEEPKEEKDDD